METSDIQHVVPRHDLIRHEIDESGDCVCGPSVAIRVREDLPDLHVFTHHSLDGRERS